jgi:hypothetical protein
MLKSLALVQEVSRPPTLSYPTLPYPSPKGSAYIIQICGITRELPLLALEGVELHAVAVVAQHVHPFQ